MNHVSTATAKQFAKIYFSDADDEVDRLVASAEEFVAAFLNYPTLSHTDLLVSQDSPPADSPGAQTLRPIIEHLVLLKFNEGWQNREIQVVGTITAENPEFIRAAHLFRRDLGV